LDSPAHDTHDSQAAKPTAIRGLLVISALLTTADFDPWFKNRVVREDHNQNKTDEDDSTLRLSKIRDGCLAALHTVFQQVHHQRTMMCPIDWMDGKGALRETHLINAANEVEIILKNEVHYSSEIIKSMASSILLKYWVDNKTVYFGGPNLMSHIDYISELIGVPFHLDD
jgi:hypothetical protein